MNKRFRLYISIIIVVLIIVIYYFSWLIKIDANTKNDWLQKNEIKSEWLGKIISTGRLLSPGKSYSINVLTDSVSKEQSLRFELRKNEYWTDIRREQSFRAEIVSTSYYLMIFPLKTIAWYWLNGTVPISGGSANIIDLRFFLSDLLMVFLVLSSCTVRSVLSGTWMTFRLRNYLKPRISL
jgi:hypothetical protein